MLTTDTWCPAFQWSVHGVTDTVYGSLASRVALVVHENREESNKWVVAYFRFRLPCKHALPLNSIANSDNRRIQ